jgi:dTDP-4-amino-4,6-dideoxygalactose transaminase
LIPFVNLSEQYRRLKSEIDARIQKVLDHNKYILGPEVAELEGELTAFSGAKHAVGCASGTDGLLMALMVLGVGPGDSVFTSPFSFISAAEVVQLLGARPVFVDVDPVTYNIDPGFLVTAIQKELASGRSRPKAVVPVDLFGLPADYDAIHPVTRRFGLTVLEDAAQSFGAVYKGKRTCSLTDLAVTSFFPSKPLGCYGDGGAVFTDSDPWAETLRSIRVHGQGEHKYDHVRLGINGRLDTLQAAVLLAKLKVFESELSARHRIAERYTAGLEGLLVTPLVPAGFVSAWAQYSVQVDSKGQRKALQAKLTEAGIPTAVYYPVPLHLQPVFSQLGYKPGDLPMAEGICERIFSLPMHPYLSMETVDRIVSIVSKECRAAKS